VCLSATVSNADEVGEWLSTVRGRTDVVVETTRPIELVNHFALFDTATKKTEMFPTVVSGEPNRHVQRLLASGSSTRGKGGHITGKKTRRFSAPSRPEIVDMLEDYKMLPAIVFIFSRAQCEDAVLSCMRAGIVLTSMDEEAQIRDIVERHCENLTADDKDALEFGNFIDDFHLGPFVEVVHQLCALVSKKTSVLKLDWSFHTDNGSTPASCKKERRAS
jgi:ATP-dependent RNA helicase HelY